jgi:hypothetical protein
MVKEIPVVVKFVEVEANYANLDIIVETFGSLVENPYNPPHKQLVSGEIFMPGDVLAKVGEYIFVQYKDVFIKNFGSLLS